MQGYKSETNAAPQRPSRRSKYLTLFIWVVGVCLSFGVYTLLVNALTYDAPEKAHAPPRLPAAPVQETAMKIDPATTLVENPGDTFSITVMIENVTDLGAFEFELTYNPTVLTATDVVTGPFLGSTGRSVTPLGPTYGSGSVSFGAFSLPPPAEGPNGDGALAIVTFQATSVGTSTLHLQNVAATNPSGGSIATVTEDGEVRVGAAPAPSVTSITPNSGASGDVVENVIVEGENFLTGASVQLTKSGQSPILATFLVVQSSTRISCTLNLGKAAAGQWNVVVTNPDDQSGTLPNGFTVDLPITITSITPNSGYSGEIVPITNLAGSNFQAGATVKLTKAGETDINATNVVVVSDSQITCDFDLAGATVGQWDVVVTNPDSQSGTLSGGFTVNPEPPVTITSITPNNGNNNEVVHVTNLAGSGFQSGATVKLIKTGQADIVATNVTVVISAQITCDLDLKGAYPGSWTVRVTNPNTDYDELADGFTVKGLLYLPFVTKDYKATR